MAHGLLTEQDEMIIKKIMTTSPDPEDLKPDNSTIEANEQINIEKEHPELKFMRIFNVEPWNLKSQMKLLKKQRVTFLKQETRAVTQMKHKVEKLQAYLVETNPEFAAKLEQQKIMASNIARMQQILAKKAV